MSRGRFAPICLVSLTLGSACGGTAPGGSSGGDLVQTCDGVVCSGHGTCVMSDGRPSCNCDTGYHGVSVMCVLDGSDDLCAGLVTSREPYPMSSLPKPAVGQRFFDPEFQTNMIRLTDVGGSGAIKPLYSPTQAWNADETYMVLYEVGVGHHLYDGKTYEHVRRLHISPPDIEQFYWSTIDPDTMYWIAFDDELTEKNHLMEYRVSTDTSTPVRAIPCGDKITADSHAWISWNSDRLGLYCPSDRTAFIYELAGGAILGSSSAGPEGAPFIGASGEFAYWHGKVVDSGMNELRTLDLDNFYEHSSMGMLESGHDTYNLVIFDPGPNGSEVGSLVTFDMTDGSNRVIVGPATGYPYPPSGTHISAPIYERPGWVFVSIMGDYDGQGLLDQELLLANTNPGGTVCRIGHHRCQENDDDYWSEPHVTGSPSGTRAIFGSNWGGGPSVDTYVVELPSYVNE